MTNTWPVRQWIDPARCRFLFVPGVPSLDDIRDADLGSISSLKVLYGQAVARGQLEDFEANFFRFLSTAAYCLRVGKDPTSLFAHLVGNGHFPANLVDEDWAVSALKEYLLAQARPHPWLSRNSERD